MTSWPTSGVIEFYLHTIRTGAETADAWQQLLKRAGLTKTVVTTYNMSVLVDYVGGLRCSNSRIY